jgi:hypothetical protein
LSADVRGLFEKIERERPVGVIGKDLLAGITPARRVRANILRLVSQ